MNLCTYRQKFFTLAIAGLFLVGLIQSLIGTSSVAHAEPGNLFVAPGGDCGAASPCFASIQAAVDAANPDDVIKVAEGTYTDVHVQGGITQMVYISKTVTVRGGYTTNNWTTPDPTAHPTTLDAQGQGRVLYITGDISPTIEGLYITGGDATGLGGYEYYGTYDAGGGVCVITATATLIHNRIFSNTAPYGGGVFMNNSGGELSDNVISDNNARSGGGLFLYKGSVRVSGNTIISNTSTDLSGGVYLLYATAATLIDNSIMDNITNIHGGGIAVASCSPILSGNIVSGNVVAHHGGGISLWYSHSILTNNVIADNQAGVEGSGIWIGGSQPQLLHTTIARNTGGDGSGVFVTDAGSTHSTLALTNTIIFSHTIGITVATDSTATLNATLWHGNGTDWSGAGTINHTNDHSGDPAFLDPDSVDYHIGPGSAAIDAGVDANVTTDIDGDSRSIGSAPDIGADEYQPFQPGDANGDGSINVQDVICIINVILDTGTASGSPDCNDDGNVNVQDVICVINKILGG